MVRGTMPWSLTAADQPSRAPTCPGGDPAGRGGDLVGVAVGIKDPRRPAYIGDHAAGPKAGYALQKDAGFVRKLRANVKEEGGVWSADAVYSISPALPEGLRTIDADVAVADCAGQGTATA